MNSLATFRKRQTPWARSALGVIVVMWLNLVLPPCAMAFGDDHDGDCPNCPPSHSMQHEGHDMASRDMADQAMPCATGIDDCSVLDEFNYDGRNGQLKVKDAPDDSPVAVLPVAELALDIKPARHSRLRPISTHPPGPPQALNKLHCVYLK